MSVLSIIELISIHNDRKSLEDDGRAYLQRHVSGFFEQGGYLFSYLPKLSTEQKQFISTKLSIFVLNLFSNGGVRVLSFFGSVVEGETPHPDDEE
jgi:hypothetical protein